jgi:hypothetical protein
MSGAELVRFTKFLELEARDDGTFWARRLVKAYKSGDRWRKVEMRAPRSMGRRIRPAVLQAVADEEDRPVFDCLHGVTYYPWGKA